MLPRQQNSPELDTFYSQNMICLSVKDNGMGIDLEKNALRALFKVYRDVEEHGSIKVKVFLRDFNSAEMRFGAESWCKSEEYSDAWASVQEEVGLALGKANLATRVTLVQMMESK